MPRTARATLVLPLPLSPTRPSVRPGSISKLTRSTARTTLARWPEQARARGVLDDEVGDLQHRRHRALPAGLANTQHAELWPSSTAMRPGSVEAQRRDRVRAARRETATSLDRPHAMRAARQHRERPNPRVDARDAREEAARIRVVRSAQHLFDRALLDDGAAIHDLDPIGDLCRDAKVVRNQEDREPAALHLLAQEVKDLRLDGDVERRRWFVGQEDLRVTRERDRDERALAHAAAELVRIAREGPGRIGHMRVVRGASARALAPRARRSRGGRASAR